MKTIRGLVLTIAVLLAGCEEDPTSVRTEQSVFGALGGLEVGESIVLTGADAQRVLLGGRAAAGTFLYVPFHASEAEGTIQLEVSGEDVSAGAVGSLAPQRLESVLSGRRVASAEMHEQLRERVARETARFLVSPRRRASLSAGIGSTRTSLSGNNAQVGQLVDLNADASANVCQGIDIRKGRVEAITQHAIIVGDVDNPAGGFTRADYEALGAQFDALVQPTVTQYFSDPTDIDENNRVIVFFTRAVNELTEDAEDGFVSGFFYARDLVPRSQCPASNEAEIFFLLAPDPNAQASPLTHSRQDVLFDAVAVIGHEYQHLINAGRRFYVNDATALEESWLDEGLSHMAEEMLFYAAAGRSPRSNLTVAEVTANPTVQNAINQFMVQNLARFGLYLEEVNEQSPTSGDDDLETRGAAWAFLRYAVDHSEQTDEDFFRLLVNGPHTGFDNLRNVVDTNPVELLRRWGVSNYTDDFIVEVDPEYTQPSWNFRNLLPALFQHYPLATRTLGGSSTSLTVEAGSSAFVIIRGVDGEVSRITTTSGGAAPGGQLRLTVVRTM